MLPKAAAVPLRNRLEDAAPKAASSVRQERACREDQVTSLMPTARPSPTTPLDGRAERDPGAYKVVFLAFPLEAYGTASEKADLMHRVLS